ncbi:DUF1194 domain-containing protein [Sulfitobacter litoralis]|uniref:DUF1194 domain-containing protein n=1 Tax=Sulfitobacter litoralis TaxID=335975 RepID=UPI002B26EF88|nr:DUF1194 domain-containing protein [Sulfitobacter litoralis]
MIRAGAVAAVGATLWASAGLADCRQALALGLDVSGSVDAREYRLQLDGVAGALEDPAVRAAILSAPEAPVSLLVYEWSGPTDQRVIAPWRSISDAAALQELIDGLRQVERAAASPGTALGVAMAAGAAYLAQRPDCLKHTLDISGDGISNLGPRPRDVKQQLAGRDLTVNALVVEAAEEGSTLTGYFMAEVISGSGAFALPAAGFDAYQSAMTTKLLRELAVLSLAQLGDAAPPALRGQ